MVLRVDVVAAALEAAYGADRPDRVIALTPQGRPLTQAIVEELAEEHVLTLLSSRFEGFDERIVEHLATDAISVGPYVLSNGDLPAMVLLDAVARRLPGALAEGSGELESFSAELDGGLEYPHYTRPAEFRGWSVPGRAPLRRPREDRGLAPGARAMRDPLGRLFPGLPRDVRVVLDWILTIARRDRDRARAQAVGRQPVPDPVVVDGADAPLREGAGVPAASATSATACSRTASSTTSATRSAARSSSSRRRRRRRSAAATGGTFVKRLIGLPGDTVSERDGFV